MHGLPRIPQQLGPRRRCAAVVLPSKRYLHHFSRGRRSLLRHGMLTTDSDLEDGDDGSNSGYETNENIKTPCARSEYQKNPSLPATNEVEPSATEMCRAFERSPQINVSHRTWGRCSKRSGRPLAGSLGRRVRRGLGCSDGAAGRWCVDWRQGLYERIQYTAVAFMLGSV